jgi:predicted acylesterase/phospholipase RssA
MTPRCLALVLLTMLLGGCGSARPTSPPDNLACGLENYAVHDDYDTFKSYMAPGRRRPLSTPTVAALKRKEVNVLELSAGGEYGAYGSGFLVGWGKLGAAARPASRQDVQVVTGVSTGALMATYAFLGDLDEELVKFYSNLSDEQIYTVRGKVSLIRANSLYDAAGKKALLARYITSDVIDRVARQPEERRLYIGFVNLDSGRFIRIDMVKLAQGIGDKAVRDDCYRGVIDAATAIEVAFPPAFIDGQMLGDGGARHHLFLVDPSYLDPTADLRDVKLRLISLVHGDLDAGSQTTTNGVLQIAERVGSIFTDQTLKDSIILSSVLATHPEVIVGDDNAEKLPRFEPFLAAAEQAACKCKQETQGQCGSETTGGGADIFCRPYMQCLARAGEMDGRSYASTGKWLPIEALNLGSQPVACPNVANAAPAASFFK